VSFAVLINGVASPFFKSERGLRQGCSLSHFLFLLVVEGLCRELYHTLANKEFHGIEISHNLILTHLLFVDDVLIFFNVTLEAIENLVEILYIFCSSTGMMINQQKSTLSVSIMLEAKI
jgi:hypothetical protein